MFWLRFPLEFSSLFRVSRGQFVLLRGLSVGSTWYRWNRCVTSRAQKLSYRLQALSSLFFDDTALLSFEIRLAGWFSRCQGQSPADWLSGRPCTKVMKGKSERANRQRVFWRTRELQEMFKRESRESSKESRESSKESRERAFCDWRVVFNSPSWPCPRAACRIRLSVWGGAPPMSRLSGVDVQVIQYFIHSVEDTNLQIIYMFSNT